MQSTSVFELLKLVFERKNAYEVAAAASHAAAKGLGLPVAEFRRLWEAEDLAFEAYREAAASVFAAFNKKAGWCLEKHARILNAVYDH